MPALRAAEEARRRLVGCARLYEPVISYCITALFAFVLYRGEVRFVRFQYYDLLVCMRRFQKRAALLRFSLFAAALPARHHAAHGHHKSAAFAKFEHDLGQLISIKLMLRKPPQASAFLKNQHAFPILKSSKHACCFLHSYYQRLRFQNPASQYSRHYLLGRSKNIFLAAHISKRLLELQNELV